jgi:hypothetical protein
LFTSSDLRAINKLNQQKSTPAHNGACTLCNIKGCSLGAQTVAKESIEQKKSRKKDTTYYLGSAYWLQQRHEARKHFEKFRVETGEYLKNIISKKPIIKTHDYVVSEMKKIEDDIKNNKKIKKYDNSYLGSSVLLSLPYLDIVRCIRFDFMHLVSNVIKSLFQFMTNSKPMVFNDDRRKMEKLLGRTWDTKDVAPFHISNDFQKLFSQIHGDLKLPLIENDYGRKRDIFSHERMRSSDY